MDAKLIGECINRNRKKCNMSLAELAEKTGISVYVLEVYEKGTGSLRADELKCISKAINVPMAALINGGGKFNISRRDEYGHRVCTYREY